MNQLTIASHATGTPLLVWTRDTTQFRFFPDENVPSNILDLNLADPEHERVLRTLLKIKFGEEKTAAILREVGELFL